MNLQQIYVLAVDATGQYTHKDMPVNATPVGNERHVQHFAFWRPSKREARKDTQENVPGANAVVIYKDKFRKVAAILGVTYYQPMKVKLRIHS